MEPKPLADEEMHAYYASRIQSVGASERIVCGFAGHEKGKAIYSRQSFQRGQHIWSEAPYVAMQHEQSKAVARCCARCFLPLFNLRAQWDALAEQALYAVKNEKAEERVTAEYEDLCMTLHYLGRRRAAQPNIMQHAPSSSDLTAFQRSITCETCETVYCSDSCREKDFEDSHGLLCPYTKESESAMARFNRHALATNEIFLLAAMVLAKIVQSFLRTNELHRASYAFKQFHKLPWWDIIVTSEDLEDGMTMEEYKGCLRDLLQQTFDIFSAALEQNITRYWKHAKASSSQFASADEVLDACQEIMSVDVFAEIVGMFELNNISLEIDHPLEALSNVLENIEMLPEHTNVYKAAQRVKMTLRLAEKNSLEGVQGTALFPIICTMNHSCVPNSTVFYTRDGQAHVFALEDIEPGDELCITYIEAEQSYEERQDELREYKFRCECPKCLQEKALVKEA